MSIRSLISVINKDGSIDCAYCHYSGSLKGNGLVLYEQYQDIDKIKKLISGGDFRRLPELDENNNPRYYNEKYSQMCHYDNMKDYLNFNLEGMIAYHYFYDEDKRKWSVGFHIHNKYVTRDLLKELKAQYYWKHRTNKFCCIVIKEFKQKTDQDTFFHFLLQQEFPYYNKMYDMIYSHYVRESEQDDGDLVIYFEPEKFQKYLPNIQEVLNKYGFDYSMTVVNEEGIKHLGTYQETSEKVKTVLLENCAECPIYNNLVIEPEEENSLSFS